MANHHSLVPLDPTVRNGRLTPFWNLAPTTVSVLNRMLARPSLLQRGESIHHPADKGKRNSLAMNGPEPSGKSGKYSLSFLSLQGYPMPRREAAQRTIGEVAFLTGTQTRQKCPSQQREPDRERNTPASLSFFPLQRVAPIG